MDATTLTQRVMEKFGDVYTVTADATSSAGILILPLNHPDAYFEGWYAWAISTPTGAPPQGESKRIASWDGSTGVATLYEEFSASPAGATIVLSVVGQPVVSAAMQATIADSTHVEIQVLDIEKCVPDTRTVAIPSGHLLARAYQETSSNIVWQGRITEVDAVNKRLYFSVTWTEDEFIADTHTANIYTGKGAGTRDYIIGNGTNYITLQSALPTGIAAGDDVVIRRVSRARYLPLVRARLVPNQGMNFPEATPGAGLALYTLRPPMDVSELPENWALWRTVFNVAAQELGRLPSNVARTVQTVAELAKAESEAARRIDQKHHTVMAFLP